MNIYSNEILHDCTNCSFFYDIAPDQHDESVYLVFERNGGNTTDSVLRKKHVLTSQAPALSAWLHLFGYDKNKTDASLMFQSIRQLSELLSAKECSSEGTLSETLKGLTPESIEDMSTKAFEILKPAVEEYPLLACMYAIIYRILVTLRAATNETSPTQDAFRRLLSYYQHFNKESECLDNIYSSTREFCEAVFETDNGINSAVSPLTISRIYREYCILSGKEYYREHPLLNIHFQSADFGEPSQKTGQSSWNSYYQMRKQSSSVAENRCSIFQAYSMEDIAYAGIDFLLETESVLRVCRLCGKHFRIKYSSSQEYCTRPYGNTKTACNEYVSRKSYKQKLLQHPIHKEFTRAYNKLYGRIRRGKLPEDTPLMDQLKGLHDKYFDKYEQALPNDAEKVLREYSVENEKLLE